MEKTPPCPTQEITDIVWDADNTIWNWVTYAVHAYEAMSQCIASETGIPEPYVAAAMKRFYTDVGTLENEFLIQGLQAMGFFKKVPKLNLEDLIHKAQATFSRVRSKYLQLYEGIDLIFQETHRIGIKNHILTDAPGFQASMRLQHFGLGELVESVNTMPAADPKTLPKKFKERQRKGKYKVPFTVRVVDKEKPYTDLEKILHLTRDQIRQRVAVIGDNLAKDGKLAIRYGCRYGLARYGFAGEDLLKRLLRFAPARTAKKNVAIEENPEISDLPENIKLINTSSDLADFIGISIKIH